MRGSHDISAISAPHSESGILSIEYGHIVGVIGEDEDARYVVIVFRERSLGPADLEPIVVPIEQTPEELASLYGTPIDLIGRRVRVEFTGGNWQTGVARIVPDRSMEARNGFTTVESRGFRYATPGRGSV